MAEETLSVGANSTSTNRLAGLIGEFLRRQSAIRGAWTASATGMKVTFVIGETIVANDAAVSTANRFPNLKDDVVGEWIGNAGRRLILTFRNSTGGALNVFWFLDLLN